MKHQRQTPDDFVEIGCRKDVKIVTVTVELKHQTPDLQYLNKSERVESVNMESCFFQSRFTAPTGDGSNWKKSKVAFLFVFF